MVSSVTFLDKEDHTPVYRAGFYRLILLDNDITGIDYSAIHRCNRIDPCSKQRPDSTRSEDLPEIRVLSVSLVN
jgi:hypothetical protein